MKERKMVLGTIVEYWCIYSYHKYKIKDIELEVMQLILIRDYN